MAGLRTRALLVGASLAVVVGFGGSTVSAATALPARVYAPYFETWTTDGITATAQASGAKYLTLAFLQSLGKTSCTLAWNGASTQTVASGRYLSDIASLRAIGGDALPSFGGWSADQGGTGVADSCQDGNQLAPAYEHGLTTHPGARLLHDVAGG